MYTGYLSLVGWIVVGLPVTILMIDINYPYPSITDLPITTDSMSEFIINAIYLISTYLLVVASSFKGIKSIKKILQGAIPNKFDFLYIILLIIMSILFWVWMGIPYD